MRRRLGAVNQIRQVLVDSVRKTVSDQLIHRVLSPRCWLCLAPADGTLCKPCRQDLGRTTTGCASCAIPLPQDGLCGQCQINPPPWHACIAAFHYGYPVDSLVHRFKFLNDMTAGRILAEGMLNAVQQQILPLPQRIVPVPLHRSRLGRRGYNQSLELARDLGKGLGIDVDHRSLTKPVATQPQAGLAKKARQQNLRKVFTCAPLNGESVALVDDVMTTGSTAEACTRALLDAGAQSVQIWVAARASIR